MFTQDERGGLLNTEPDNPGQALLNQALAQLHARDVDTKPSLPAMSSDQGYDLRLRTQVADTAHEYAVTLKARVNSASIAKLTSAWEYPSLLIAPYINARLGRTCRDLGIDYVDSVGNMHLRWRNVLIHVEGARPPKNELQTTTQAPRTFQPSGLKVVFLLLCDPEMINAPFRSLATSSDTSLGTVQWVINELVDMGFAESRPGRRRLHRRRELFEKWVEAYAFALRPKLHLGRFDTEDVRDWVQGSPPIRDFGGQWGSETAAFLLDDYISPSTSTIYIDRIPADLLARFRLRKSGTTGRIEFRKHFWHLPALDEARTVPSPLVYADLVASSDSRLLQTAQKLRESDDLLRRIYEL